MYDKKDDESYTNMYRTHIDYENNYKVLCCYDDINLVKFIKAKAQFTSLQKRCLKRPNIVNILRERISRKNLL